MFMDLQWFTERVIIIHPGTELIITQDPGHGDSTLPILRISDGDLAGGTARAGLVLGSASVMDMAMDMVMVTAMQVAVGGALLSIIRHVGVDGMEAQDLMDFMEVISTCTIMYM